MIHFVAGNQASKDLGFIQHGIDMLWDGQVLRFSATRYKGDALAFRDFLDNQ